MWTPQKKYYTICFSFHVWYPINPHSKRSYETSLIEAVQKPLVIHAYAATNGTCSDNTEKRRN
jgi:hypothetical protein